MRTQWKDNGNSGWIALYCIRLWDRGSQETSLQHSGLNVERNGGEREGKRGRETMSTDRGDQ